jgi:GT2 family glycosyltransferase
MPAVSVVVLNYNGKHYLEPCLSSLEKQTCRDFEVILVDNGSSDGSVEYVENNWGWVRVIALGENLGFCGGNNVGIREARGKYVALLNNDTEVDPRWLEELETALDNALNDGENVGFCASKMLVHGQPHTIDTAGDVFYACGVGGKRGYLEKDNGQYDEVEYVFGACAGAALYRRAMLEDIGLLDEDFFIYDDDIDLSFRAQLRGYKCLFVPTAIVYHKIGGTVGKTSDFWLYLSRRNMLYVLIKNVPGRLLLRNLHYIMAYLLLGDLLSVLRGKGRHIWRARLDNLRNLRKTLRKRKEIQRRRRVSDHYIASMLIGGRRMRKRLGSFLSQKPGEGIQ